MVCTASGSLAAKNKKKTEINRGFLYENYKNSLLCFFRLGIVTKVSRKSDGPRFNKSDMIAANIKKDKIY